MSIRFAAFLFAAALAAQSPNTPGTPEFDVVSIRLVPPNAPPVMRDIGFTPILPGGRYLDSRVGLHEMIALAYNVKNWMQLVGLPNWANNQSYAVAAKPSEDFPTLPPAQNIEQVRLMLRAMLADRFHLQLHAETRREPVFNLEIAKGGIKIKEVDPPVPPAKEGYVGSAGDDRGGRLIGQKSTMAGLAIALNLFLQRPLIDQTGLKGYYDFDVKWTAPPAPDRQPSAPGLGADGAALVISVLQEKFGLRVTKTTASLEYWVVDHIEQPTEN